MKIKKNVRQSVLATLVALSLSAGTAWAMPMEPTIVVGGDNINVSDVANIGVNANGLIDWKSFSIAQGEAVNFAFGGAGGWEIINHVTGSQLSEILGTLSSTGNGHVTLINPNGIFVGSTAVIDVGGLTLSTLQVSDELLTNYLKGSADLVFGDASKASTAMIEIKDGATINFGEMLELYGGKIQIADGVTISNVASNSKVGMGLMDEPGDTYISMAAANAVKPYRQGHEAVVEASELNTLAIGKTDISDKKINSLDVDVWGGTVTLDNTTFQSSENGNMETTLIAGNSISRGMAESGGGEIISVVATPANKLTVNSATITTYDNIHLFGGAIEVNNSDLSVEAGDYDYIAVLAGNKIRFVDDEYNNFSDAILERGTGNVLNIDSSKLTVSRQALDETKSIPRDFMLGAEEMNLTGSDAEHKTVITAAGTMEIEGGQKLAIANAELSGRDIWTHGRVTEIENSQIASQGALKINAFTSKWEDGKTEYTANDVVKVTNSSLSASGEVDVKAGAINVDNSTITSQGELNLTAVQSIVYRDDGTEFTTDNNNKIIVSNDAHLKALGKDHLEIRTGALSVDNSELKAHHIIADVAKHYQSTKVNKEETGNVQEADVTNAISITNSTVETVDDVDMRGGTISIDNSTFNAPYVELAAAGKHSYDKENDAVTTVSVVGNTVRLNQFTQNVPDDVSDAGLKVQAGSIKVEGDKGFNSKVGVFLGAGPELTFVGPEAGGKVGFTKLADEQSDLISLSDAAKSSLQDIQSKLGYQLTTLKYASADTGGNSGSGGSAGGGGSAGSGGNSGGGSGISGGGSGSGGGFTPSPATPTVTPAATPTTAPATQPEAKATQTPAPAEPVSDAEGVSEVNAILKGDAGEAKLQEAAKIISVTPKGQEMNQTFHQEVDKAADAPAADLSPAAAVNPAGGASVMTQVGAGETGGSVGVTMAGAAPEPGNAGKVENVSAPAKTGADDVSSTGNNEEEQE